MLKKKTWIVALFLAFTMAFIFVGCPVEGDLASNPIFQLDPNAGMEWTEVFKMSTDAGIQALAAGNLTFDDDAGEAGNPITPLYRAAQDIDTLAIETVGGKKAIKITISNTWGVGIDLTTKSFGFREGDKITVKGSGSATAPVTLNSKVGGNPVNIGTPASGTTADFTIVVAELTANDIANIKTGTGGQGPSIRIECRGSAGVSYTITDIIIEGYRASELSPLPAPSIAVNSSTGVVSWTAVANAGSYDVYAKLLPSGTNTKIVSQTATSINMNMQGLADGNYEISVVAKGIPNVSLDSPVSNKVTYGVVTPDPQYIAVTIDGTATAADIEVIAVMGEVEAEADNSGFTFTRGADYGSSFAYFQVNLGAKKISDFGAVTLNYTAISGDTDYKALQLIASDVPITSTLIGTNRVNDDWYNTGWNNGREDGPQCNTGETNKAYSLAINDRAANAGLTGNVYFSIYFGAAAVHNTNGNTVFKITDIEFVEGKHATIVDGNDEPGPFTVEVGDTITLEATLPQGVTGTTITYAWTLSMAAANDTTDNVLQINGADNTNTLELEGLALVTVPPAVSGRGGYVPGGAVKCIISVDGVDYIDTTFVTVVAP